MKLRYIIFLLLAVSSLTFAQKKRYLISPNQEVIPLDKNESARLVMEARIKAKQVQNTNACLGSVLDGFPPNPYNKYVNSRFGGYHKDVFGEWFQAKYTGSIDTIFWQSTGDDVGAKDTTVYVRVHESYIGPTYGPGIRPGPFNPPCQNWGYFKNSNDLDRQVAAFPDDTPVPDSAQWVSTIAAPQPATHPPFGGELWGSGGWPVKYYKSSILHATMADLNPLNVAKGDLFFISIRINGPASHVVDDATRFYAGELDTRLSEFREYYPSRDWKFYEHDSGPTNCAGIAVNNVKRGWVARGGFTDDTLKVGFFQWWYSISTLDNTPPSMISSNTIHNTFDTGTQEITAEIEDCDNSNPAQAGVASAYARWTATSDISGVVTTGVVNLSNVGGNNWEGTLPGFPAWTEVSYVIIAADTKGLLGIFPQSDYRIIASENGYAKVDSSGGSLFNMKMSSGCTWNDIHLTGTEIPDTSFFLAYAQPADTNAADDGTAGPFKMDPPFTMFDQTFNYAWVGVNGAISLSKSALDTNDVNADGSYTTGWTIPGTIRYGASRDTGQTLRKPKNFIAPFWADLFYGDVRTPAPNQWGHIYHQDDACKFVVQWGPGIGIFPSVGDKYTADSLNFRVVLNKCDGTVQFQYQNLMDNDTALVPGNCLVGFSMDTIATLGEAPWAFVSKDNYPPEHAPQTGLCLTFTTKSTTLVNDKWNMISLASVPADTNQTIKHRFPIATFYDANPQAFRYSAGYVQSTTLTSGYGYWLKFKGRQVIGSVGTKLTSLAIPVVQGWNMIGTISCPVATISIDDACVAGASYFGFNSGYQTATTLVPGLGYWVKANAAGTINLTCSTVAAAKVDPNIAQLNGFSTINVRDNVGGNQILYLGNASLLKVPADQYELPPVPMEGMFDVRFASNRNVETYTSDANKIEEYTIKLQSNAYPIVLQYNIVDKGKSLVITENDNSGKSISNAALNGRGVIRITNSSVTSVKVRVIDNGGLPKTFALSQNYPNPFNPVTRFSVDIPTFSDVDISVYDIIGRKIATLMSGQHDAGRVTIEWDGQDSPSGVYFVRMNAGSFSEVRKIMLLK